MEDGPTRAKTARERKAELRKQKKQAAREKQAERYGEREWEKYNDKEKAEEEKQRQQQKQHQRKGKQKKQQQKKVKQQQVAKEQAGTQKRSRPDPAKPPFKCFLEDPSNSGKDIDEVKEVWAKMTPDEKQVSQFTTLSPTSFLSPINAAATMSLFRILLLIKNSFLLLIFLKPWKDKSKEDKERYKAEMAEFNEVKEQRKNMRKAGKGRQKM